MFESFLGVNPWTALFILLNTLTIFFVAKKYLFGPVMKMIEDRQKEIDDMYLEAGTAKTEAQAMEAEYKKKLSAASETSERIVKHTSPSTMNVSVHPPTAKRFRYIDNAKQYECKEC